MCSHWPLIVLNIKIGLLPLRLLRQTLLLELRRLVLLRHRVLLEILRNERVFLLQCLLVDILEELVLGAAGLWVLIYIDAFRLQRVLI